MRECPECRSAIDDAARFCPHCGSAAPDRPGADPWIGRVVNGKFRVEALVGEGGMGRVYRARHLGLDRVVVLKLLHRALGGDPQVAQRFQREARAASRLSHPNSIAVLDFGEAEDGTLFMAMEHVAGKDLARVLAEEAPLGEARLVRIGAQILSALSEAHAQGVVHRDLKPENVVVEPRGDAEQVKVLDFGIAKITAPGADEPRLTQVGLVCGTPEYMSPEQARGAELDLRSDLYSTGVLLYQMATGELPFASETPVGFLTKHVTEVPAPARQRNPRVSARLEAVIARALEKDPARRFQTAGDMREALLACAAERRDAPRRSRRAFWAFAAAVALAVAGGGGVVLLARKGAEERRGRPEGIAPARAAATPTATSTATATATPTATPTSDPAEAQRLFQQAEARRAAQDVDGAIRLYLAAEAADPGLAEVQKKLALCYQLKGDTKRAAERYRRYLETDPRDADRVRAILTTLR
jgi:hypothetical protein